MNILLTGCTGFIGSNILKILSQKHTIFCISTSSECLNKNHLTWDLSNNLLEKNLEDRIDVLIHNAGVFGNNIDFEDLMKHNFYSTKNLLEFSLRKKLKKIIYISSGAVYGYKKHIINENTKANPMNYYALSKYYSEILLSNFFLKTIILRLFFPYGPKQKRGIIPKLTHSLIKNEPITIYNNYNPIINPLFISDLLKIIEYLVESNIQKGTFNLGGLENVSVYELANMLSNFLNNKSPNFEFIKDKKIKNLYCAPSKLYKKDFIYPKVSIKEGLKLFLNFEKYENTTFAT